MKIEHDKIADAKYIRIKKGKVAKTKKEKSWLLFDYNDRGVIIGVEILDASKHQVSLSVVNNELIMLNFSDYQKSNPFPQEVYKTNELWSPQFV